MSAQSVAHSVATDVGDVRGKVLIALLQAVLRQNCKGCTDNGRFSWKEQGPARTSTTHHDHRDQKHSADGSSWIVSVKLDNVTLAHKFFLGCMTLADKQRRETQRPRTMGEQCNVMLGATPSMHIYSFSCPPQWSVPSDYTPMQRRHQMSHLG